MPQSSSPFRLVTRQLRCFLCVLALASLAALTPQLSEAANRTERYALVVGIADYERARDLLNPTNDARAVAERLVQLGYTLHGGQAHDDLSRDELTALFRAFARSVPQGATAVVYLAGHGVGWRGDTYLIPSDDAGLMDRDDLRGHAVKLGALTSRLAGRPGVNAVVFVDACRANGLRRAEPSGDVLGAGGPGDLVVGVSGSLSLVYAAAPGQIALDGIADSPLSPFAAALLAALESPGRSLDALNADISQRVRSASDGRQTPWILRTYPEDGPLYLAAP